MNLVQTFKTRTRSPLRPRSSDIIHRIFTDFRNYGAKGDSLILGQSHFMGKTVFVVGQQKPKPEQFRSKEDVNKLNWGMLDADEHAQILAFLRMLADKAPQQDAVLLSLVDTYGADISMYSARRLQAFFISHLIKAYLNVPVPTISVVLGEGGSGGAVCVQMADRRGGGGRRHVCHRAAGIIGRDHFPGHQPPGGRAYGQQVHGQAHQAFRGGGHHHSPDQEGERPRRPWPNRSRPIWNAP